MILTQKCITWINIINVLLNDNINFISFTYSSRQAEQYSVTKRPEISLCVDLGQKLRLMGQYT